MAHSTRTWTLLIVFAVVLVIIPGWLSGQRAAQRKTLPAPKSWKLTVGPPPDCKVTETGTGIDVPWATVDKTKGHTIEYEPAQNEVLKGIIIHGPEDNPSKPFQKPFRDVAFVGTDANGKMLWAVPCSYESNKNVCKTGPVETGAKGDKYQYKTDQSLRGKKLCDAGIIIQP